MSHAQQTDELVHRCVVDAAMVVGLRFLSPCTPPARLSASTAQPILEGDQLTACYLGQERFAPVAHRRTRLRSLYGFHCKCPR
jgi:hypothetical protein